jgi:hypothetical protein
MGAIMTAFPDFLGHLGMNFGRSSGGLGPLRLFEAVGCERRCGDEFAYHCRPPIRDGEVE